MVSSLANWTPLYLSKWLMLCRAHTKHPEFLEFQNWNELKRWPEKLNGCSLFFRLFQAFWKIADNKESFICEDSPASKRILSSKKHSLPGKRHKGNVIEKHEIDFWFKRPPRISLRLAFSGVYSMIYIVVRASSRYALHSNRIRLWEQWRFFIEDSSEMILYRRFSSQHSPESAGFAI